MNEIKEAVLRCHNTVLKERGIDSVSSVEMSCTRDNGIDSIGIVSLILDIEEELDMELDFYLPQIRSCKTIGELIGIIESIER